MALIFVHFSSCYLSVKSPHYSLLNLLFSRKNAKTFCKNQGLYLNLQFFQTAKKMKQILLDLHT
ncbi:hypothetical protein B0A65_09205 [Flavobacterium frigidimaris]|uniref:Uncharacterized protein n=1 Tax=Flavobacterium frigidimaris TaxID=262320 RepID=A0ABX4BQU9_FLAFR|nr:hypothetical protein B0A65_09205 [Flavobacterium frigidimaris]